MDGLFSYFMENPIKIDDLGVAPLQETSFFWLLNMIVTQWTIKILLIPWITMVTLWNIVFYYNNGMMYVIYFGYIGF